jgi:putative transcriptional regulator
MRPEDTQASPKALMPMAPEAVEAAALRDPDAQPLTDADAARLRPVPRARTLRRALGLTQEEFATRFQIPLGTLRDWEQGRAEPDQPARAYLKAIAGGPEAIQRALQSAAAVGG